MWFYRADDKIFVRKSDLILLKILLKHKLMLQVESTCLIIPYAQIHIKEVEHFLN